MLKQSSEVMQVEIILAAIQFYDKQNTCSKILEFSKLNASADDKIMSLQFWEMFKKGYEKHSGKWKILLNHHFLSLSQCFQIPADTGIGIINQSIITSPVLPSAAFKVLCITACTVDTVFSKAN